jgi:hypothetical protein
MIQSQITHDSLNQDQDSNNFGGSKTQQQPSGISKDINETIIIV